MIFAFQVVSLIALSESPSCAGFPAAPEVALFSVGGIAPQQRASGAAPRWRTATPNARLSNYKSILLRLPEMVIEELKILANKRDVPYQSLLKQFVCERIAQELKAVS